MLQPTILKVTNNDYYRSVSEIEDLLLVASMLSQLYIDGSPP